MSSPAPSEWAGGRLASLDAYRGFWMLVLISGRFFTGVISGLLPEPVAGPLVRQFDHPPWAGCTLWDLIMPAFMLMVGVSLPYSYASRVAKGHSRWQIRLHVLQRICVFVLLGLLLSSNGYPRTRFNFTGLLTQFALAYPWAFLMVGRSVRVQSAAIGGILIGYGLAFSLTPLPPEGFDFASVGLPENVEPFTGLFAHWNRGTNLGARFDLWFVNLFPQIDEYRFDPLGNQTLDFIPGIAVMTLGVMVGELLRSSRAPRDKLRRLVASGTALLGAGWLVGQTLCPIVKYLFTPSYVLWSGGLTILSMAAFYWAIEIRGWSGLAFPLGVVGMNSLAIYLLNALWRPWLEDAVRMHLLESWTGQQLAVVVVLWWIALWMYRRRIFLRV